MAITYLGGAASQSAGGSCDITIGSGVTTSQGIIVLAAVDTNSFPAAPTDTAGNTYVRDDGFNAGGPSLDIAIFSCLTPTALSAGNVITLSTSIGSNRQAWHAYKFDLPIAFDGTGGTSNGEGRGSGTAVSDNLQPLTTTNANDCLFGAVLADTASTLTGVTAGWNAASTPSVTTDTGMRLFAFSQVVSATGTYPLSGTLGTSSNWEVVNAGYKYTVGGGGTTYTKTGAGTAKLYASGVRSGNRKTLGQTSTAAPYNQDDTWSAAGLEVAFGPFTMTENGTLTNITSEWSGIGSTDPYTIQMAIWNDNAGAPGTRFAYCETIDITSGAAMQAWTGSSITGSTALVSGNKYWIGFLVTQYTSGGGHLNCKLTGAAAGSCNYQTGQGTGPPTNPFPSASSTAEEATIYLTYSPAGSGTVYTKTGAGVAKLYATGIRRGVRAKTGAAVAKLYGRGARTGGRALFVKTGGGGAPNAWGGDTWGSTPWGGADIPRLYSSGVRVKIGGFRGTLSPIVPFPQQASNAVYAKTGAAVNRLYATGAEQYLIGGTGTLYQKTGAATARLFDTGDSENVYASSGAAAARLYVTGARTGGTIPPPPTPPLYVLRDAVFTVAGFDLSNHVDSVEVLIHQDMIDITKYGDTAIHYTLGLRTDQITCTFIQDFGLSTVHSVISNLLASSGFTVTAKPRSGVTAVTNPLYSATCIVTSYTPLSAKVGDRSDAPVVFQAISPITQATS